jgi:hypothetical protein
MSLTADEQARADKEFDRLADLIDAPKLLTIAILRHWIWMTKRRAVGLPICDHLALIFFNQIQGTGKTEFVKKFLEPLAELASKPINFEQITNDFAMEIFEFYSVAFLDDLGALPAKKVADWKRKLTADEIQMRPPGSSRSEVVRMKPTYIATTNKRELIPDETGNRREAVLPLKNGSVERGGDPAVRATINDLDYRLLWRSVNELEHRSPIKDVLNELVRYQAGWAPVDPVVAWLRTVDRKAAWVRRAAHPRGGVRAKALYDRFALETGSSVKITPFGLIVTKSFDDPSVPFYKRHEGRDCNVYLWKPQPDE